MGTKVKGGGGEYKTHEAGVFAAICIDVIDMGLKATKFGTKDHIRLVFCTTEPVEVDGKERLSLIVITMTKTIGKDSNLRKFLESWRGKAFTAEELDQGFDVDDLLGVPAMLNIVHRPSADGSKTYANVASASRVPKGMPLPDPDEAQYMRVRDRSKTEQQEYFEKFRGDGEGKPAMQSVSSKAPKRAPVNDNDIPALDDDDDDLPF